MVGSNQSYRTIKRTGESTRRLDLVLLEDFVSSLSSVTMLDLNFLHTAGSTKGSEP